MKPDPASPPRTPGKRRALIPGLLFALVLLAANAAEPKLPIFDAHIHYSHDAWDSTPPKAAIAILRKAGLKRAMVSSSSDDGTQKLRAEAPDLVVPALRPYRKRGEISTWVRDESVIGHVEERLKKYRYAAIGEFHVYGADADLPVMRRMTQLARQYKLWLHLHGDSDAIERVMKQDPEARILWAHSGFDRPEAVRAMLRKYPRLHADLAFRNDHASGGKTDPAWREAFLEFPDRFLVGTDTFTPERWHYIVEHADWSRGWLADLPRDVAEKIGWRNGETLFASMMTAKQ
ncbi:MAG: amidohydrolase [Rhodocyclales bacterium]|nr:amidohydrolase [Rhodocyclales bacterium]